MAEAASAGGAPSTAGGAPPPAAPSTAGATLTSMPTGPDWASSFKDDTKSYIAQKGFKTPEALAESYRHLETKLSSRAPDERTLVLPEKFEGAEARAVFERLGAPKEAKGYEIPRDEKAPDPKFAEWAESTFFEQNLTKTQAQGLAKAYNDRLMQEINAQAEQRRLALSHADETLKKEWGQHFDANIQLAKQGAKILGLDAKTLDMIEAIQGRENLFKTLQKIGVGVGESNFVDGGTATSTALSPEQAAAEMAKLMKDEKFQKKWNRGDVEAMAKWDQLNQAAAPGQKTIG